MQFKDISSSSLHCYVKAEIIHARKLKGLGSRVSTMKHKSLAPSPSTPVPVAE